MKNKKIIIIVGLVILVAISGLLAYRYKLNNQDYIVSINGEKVCVGEFKFMLDSVRAQMEQKGLSNFDTIIDGKKASEFAKDRALQSIIKYKIEAQQAKEQGVALEQDEIKKINDEVDRICSENSKLVESLNKSGLSIDDLKRINIEFSTADVFKEQILKQINANVTISDEEAKDYYEKNKELYYAREEMVRAKHILIKTIDESGNELSSDVQEQKKEKINEILKRAKSGEDFDALVKQFSEDPGSKDNGGEYLFPREQMDKEFENAAFALKPGEISNVVKTTYGYHIIKLEEKFVEGQTIGFEALKNTVKVDAQYNKMFEDWKKKSTIIRKDELYNSI